MLRITFLAACTIAALNNLPPVFGDQKDKKASEDVEFVKNAASGGMMEVELGKLGKSKAVNPDVKSFATKMEVDHTAVNNDLKRLARTIGIEIPKAMLKKHEDMVKHMKEHAAKDFDREFMKHMVKDHETDVADFKKASQNAKNAELRMFATKTLPILEGHLKLAKDIQKKLP